MKTADVFPSRYLKAEELDEDLTVTIREVVMETFTDRERGTDTEKPVAYFEELEKGLIINKTNWSQIAKQHGDESDEWPGKAIVLTVMDVSAFGDVVSAIRIRSKTKSAKPKSGDSATPALIGRWSDLVREAQKIGIEVEPIAGDIGKDELIRRGKQLKAAIDSFAETNGGGTPF